MTKKTPAGWHAYSEMGELLTELDLTGEDMARAQEATGDHIRAWHLAMVRTEQDRAQDDVAQAMGVTQPRVSAIGDLGVGDGVPLVVRSVSSLTSATRNTGLPRSAIVTMLAAPGQATRGYHTSWSASAGGFGGVGVLVPVRRGRRC